MNFIKGQSKSQDIQKNKSLLLEDFKSLLLEKLKGENLLWSIEDKRKKSKETRRSKSLKVLKDLRESKDIGKEDEIINFKLSINQHFWKVW